MHVVTGPPEYMERGMRHVASLYGNPEFTKNLELVQQAIESGNSTGMTREQVRRALRV